MIQKTLLGFFLLTVVTFARAGNRDFIYMENGKFYQGCEPFYPMMMNYTLLFEDSAGTYRITPPMNRCRDEGGCNSCGTTSLDYRAYIVSHLRTIEAMGFNVVRIVGLSMQYNEGSGPEPGSGTLCTNRYYKFREKGKGNPHCHQQTKEGLTVLGREEFKRHGDLIAQLFDIIREENIPLKVMLLTGSHGVEIRHEAYAEYLKYLAERFSGEPALFAYDLYNEPQYQEKIETNAFDKYDRAEWFYSWYKVIKDKAPWHFVTYGPVITDVFSWDPEVMPSDFFSYHIYSPPRENLNWNCDSAFIFYKVNLDFVSRSFTRPWIIGETGLSAVDRGLFSNLEIHPVVRSEGEQRTFFKEALKYSAFYGAGGFAVWNYKDALWSFEQAGTYPARQFFTGLVNFRENDTWKPAAYDFLGFDPHKPCPDCNGPSPDEISNPQRNPFPVAEGYVFMEPTGRDAPVPYQGALINALVGKPGSAEFNHSCMAFTDASGKFTLGTYHEDENIVVKLVRISAPSMSFIYKDNWGDGLTFDAPFVIHPLDQDRLPEIHEVQDVLMLSGRKTFTWDRKRIMQAKDLVIKKGCRLVITDTLYMRPGGTIEVMEGATLEIDGGAISGLCTWEGVKTYEPRRKGSRPVRSTGKVIRKNGATITGAQHGIRIFNAGGELLEQGQGE